MDIRVQGDHKLNKLSFRVDVYTMENLPQEITLKIEEDFYTCSEILNLPPYINEVTSDDSFWEGILDYPPEKKIPPKLANSLGIFSSDILGENANYMMELYRKHLESWEDIITDFSSPLLNIIFATRRLLAEQLIYIESVKNEKNCEVYYIQAMVMNIDKEGSNYPYGGIFLSRSKDNPEQAIIQGITKFLTPQLVSYFNPFNGMKSLNEVLMPVMESFAKSIGITELQVAPIGKQGSILVKYYGFTELRKDNLNHPCNMILGSEENLDNYGNVYHKYL